MFFYELNHLEGYTDIYNNNRIRIPLPFAKSTIISHIIVRVRGANYLRIISEISSFLRRQFFVHAYYPASALH